ncbi:MucBP domain-containing protein, partial [Streptococcus pluranimalium]|uniref:MucBP domain-containing protein n=1 Tax=Streptococcus pluranimalium TaxID=82348 RepID=UPI004046D131
GTFVTADGRVFKYTKMGDNSANPTGDVTEASQHVQYVYTEVKGNVVVHYVNEAGETIKGDVVDTPSTSTSTSYDTRDNKPGVIVTADGTRYVLVPAKTQGSEDGKVVEGTTHITYVYAKAANWIPQIPGVPNPPKVPYPFDPTNPDKPVDPSQPIVPGGDVPVIPYVPGYEPVIPLVPVDPEDPTKGYIPPVPEVPGEDTPIPYKPVMTPIVEKGNVVVTYKTTEGKEIKTPVVDTPESPVGTTYTTTDNKLSTITTPDGKTYKIVPNLTEGSETGKIVPGTTTVTYVYTEVKGNVVVHYVNEAGETIKGDVVDTPSTSTSTSYDTRDNKPGVIVTADGTRYVLVPAKTQGSEDGKVVEGTTHITYVYAKAANWIPQIPGVPNPPKVPYPFDPTNPDKPVDPSQPIVPGGDVPVIPYVPGYEPVIPLVPVDPEDPTKGYIPPVPEVPGEDTPIPYKPVMTPIVEKGNVVVTYKTTEGKEIKTPVVDTPESPVGTTYTTTDNKLSTITTPDGKTYKIVPNLTEGSETGKIVPGTTTVTYVYEEVKGDVVVHYVNEAGETIKGDVVDTPSTSTGTSYDTRDNKPGVIVTADGTRYVLVPAKTQGSEEGKVVEGTTHITYVYAKAANWVPLIPSEPNPPKVPYPFDPTNPDKPVDPEKPNVPGGDKPLIPHVPGYYPVNPKDNQPLVPVDPTDPTKGYIPPVPEVPGEDTPIPYIPVTPEKPVTPTPEQPTNPETPKPVQPEKPVDPAAPRPVSPDQPVEAALPNTGEAGSAAAMLGAGLLTAALGLFGRRRKED